MQPHFSYYLGVDAGYAHHVAVLCDATGTPVSEWTVDATVEGVMTLVDHVAAQVDGAVHTVAVGIEQPHDPVVELFQCRDAVVYTANPKALERFRASFQAAPCKDDRRDAWQLAEAVRLGLPALREVTQPRALVQEIRWVNRQVLADQQECQRLGNRLRTAVHTVAPGLLSLCPAADEPWFWALLAQGATPEAAQAVSQATIAQLLQTFRIRRHSVETVWTTYHTAWVPVAGGVYAGIRYQIAALIEQLQACDRVLQAGRRQLTTLLDQWHTELRQETPEHPTVVEILWSSPGTGERTLPTLIGEGWALLEAAQLPLLRTYSGQAPVTIASGNSKRVEMRRACNPWLRQALHHISSVFWQHDPRARALYQAHRAQGQRHSRALRTVGDRWLAMICAMIRTKTVYDPAKRQGLGIAKAA